MKIITPLRSTAVVPNWRSTIPYEPGPGVGLGSSWLCSTVMIFNFNLIFVKLLNS